MSDHDALWRNLLEDPGDDVARLVYADWLEEQGQAERAAFIRTQIALASTDPADPTYPDVLGRSLEQLLSTNGRRHDAIPSAAEVAYQRGFAESLRIPAPQLIRQPLHTWASMPIRNLWVGRSTMNRNRAERGDWRQLVGLLARHPLMAQIESCRFQPTWPTVQGWEAESLVAFFAACSTLQRLRHLTVDGFGMDDAQLETILRSSGTQNLRSLSITEANDPTFDYLTNDEREWERLRITGYYGTNAALERWAASAHRERITSFFLGCAGEAPIVDGFDLDWLFGQEWPALQELGLEYLNLGESGGGWWHRLLEWPTASQLRALHVRFVSLAPNEIERLAECGRFTELRHLSLMTAVQEAELAALLRSPHFPRLRRLDIQQTIPTFFRVVREHPSAVAEQLVELRFPTNLYQGYPVRELLQGAPLPNLTILELPATNELNFPVVSDDQWQALAESPHFPRLRLIGLGREVWYLLSDGRARRLPDTVSPLPFDDELR